MKARYRYTSSNRLQMATLPWWSRNSNKRKCHLLLMMLQISLLCTSNAAETNINVNANVLYSKIETIRIRLNENLCSAIMKPAKRVRRKTVLSMHGKENNDVESGPSSRVDIPKAEVDETTCLYIDGTDDSFGRYGISTEPTPQMEDPSYLSLCLRASKLCFNFSPCMASSGLAYFSKTFRSNIWYPLIVKSLSKSGPAFIKWGQWASTRSDMFPEELCVALNVLHASAPLHSWRYTQREVEGALNIPHGCLMDVFEEFEETPIASGSIAQVHRAKLRRPDTPPITRTSQQKSQSYAESKRYTDIVSSAHVAVKVRHPQVARLIDCDFRIMRSLALILDSLPSLKWLNVGESISQFSHTMAAQAHLDVEAHHLDILNDNFRSWGCVGFPRPIFATSSIIIETFERGSIVTSILDMYEEGNSIHERLSDGKSLPADLAKFIVTNGVSLYLKMLLIDNLMHADLHPGNIMVFSNRSTLEGASSQKALVSSRQSSISSFQGFITLVDAGMVAELDEKESLNFIGLLASLGEGDGLAGANAVLGFPTTQQLSPEEADLFRNDMIKLFYEKCKGYGNDVDVGDVLRGVLTLIRIHRVRIDANYATLVVNALCVESLAKRVCPDYNVLDSAKPLLRSYKMLYSNSQNSIGPLLFRLSIPFQYMRKSMIDNSFFARRRRIQEIETR